MASFGLPSPGTSPTAHSGNDDDFLARLEAKINGIQASTNGFVSPVTSPLTIDDTHVRNNLDQDVRLHSSAQTPVPPPAPPPLLSPTTDFVSTGNRRFSLGTLLDDSLGLDGIDGISDLLSPSVKSSEEDIENSRKTASGIKHSVLNAANTKEFKDSSRTAETSPPVHARDFEEKNAVSLTVSESHRAIVSAGSASSIHKSSSRQRKRTLGVSECFDPTSIHHPQYIKHAIRAGSQQKKQHYKPTIFRGSGTKIRHQISHLKSKANQEEELFDNTISMLSASTMAMFHSKPIDASYAVSTPPVRILHPGGMSRKNTSKSTVPRSLIFTSSSTQSKTPSSVCKSPADRTPKAAFGKTPEHIPLPNELKIEELVDNSTHTASRSQVKKTKKKRLSWKERQLNHAHKSTSRENINDQWEKVRSTDGSVFFYNSKTEKSQRSQPKVGVIVNNDEESALRRSSRHQLNKSRHNRYDHHGLHTSFVKSPWSRQDRGKGSTGST